ncbi:MAG: DUF5691 domain-containing protein [Chloroflexota bacterium]
MLPEPLIPFVVRGTAQSADQLPPLSPAIDRLVTHFADQGIEAMLLAAAGSAALQQKVGVRADEESTPKAGAPAHEPLQLAPAKAQAYLARGLYGEYPAVMGEWLDLALSHQLYPAPELLPALLSYGGNHPEHRYEINKLLGSRGVWLAGEMTGKRRDWVILPPERQWEKSKNKSEKEGLLKLTRRQDPHRGRTLLETVWEKASGESRFHYLNIFQKDLVEEDIPFLEKRLTEGTAETRRQAADMLAYFPGSQLVQTVAPKIKPLVKVVSRPLLGSKLTLDIDQLKALAERLPEFQHYRSEKPPTGSLLTDIFELSDLISFVPIEDWLTRFKLDLPTLWQLISKVHHSVKPILEIGIAAAVVRSRQRRYALDLLNCADLTKIAPLATGLYDVLSPTDLEGIVLETLENHPKLHKENPAYSTVMRHTTCFTPAFSRRIISAWAEGLKSRVADHDIQFNLHLSRYIDPAERFFMIDQLAALPTDPKAYRWNKSVEEADLRLQFRHGMRSSFLIVDSE